MRGTREVLPPDECRCPPPHGQRPGNRQERNASRKHAATVRSEGRQLPCRPRKRGMPVRSARCPCQRESRSGGMRRWGLIGVDRNGNPLRVIWPSSSRAANRRRWRSRSERAFSRGSIRALKSGPAGGRRQRIERRRLPLAAPRDVGPVSLRSWRWLRPARSLALKVGFGWD